MQIPGPAKPITNTTLFLILGRVSYYLSHKEIFNVIVKGSLHSLSGDSAGGIG